MSWPCELLPIIGSEMVVFETPREGGIAGKTYLKHEDGRLLDWKELPIGTMFAVPKDADMDQWPWYLASPENIADHNRDQTPIFVILPSRTLFLIHGTCWQGTRRYGGWGVSGEVPNLTVTPSINIGGFYHGWLTNGLISDDCEGRKYDAEGNLLHDK